MSLYHYTNLDAVHSILTNRTIRLTDIRFLNDTEELREGLTTIDETILNRLSATLKYEVKALEAIRNQLTDAEFPGIELEPLYIFSLSSVRDQLSQWRAYGSYAIEFDENQLQENVENLSQCIYELNKKIRRSEIEVNKAATVIAKDMEKYDGCIGPESLDAMICLLYDAARFKHDGFIEEGESRVIMQSGEIEPQYFSRKGILIPYIDLELPLDCIKSVEIGPMENQDLAYISMRDFVSQIESNWQHETSNIEYEFTVEKSLIPYRA
ncbi:MAG: hypothetical protein ACJA0I_001027 [Gammaproteobacteria bacterium]|jgi:hypothetical protein